MYVDFNRKYVIGVLKLNIEDGCETLLVAPWTTDIRVPLGVGVVIILFLYFWDPPSRIKS